MGHLLVEAFGMKLKVLQHGLIQERGDWYTVQESCQVRNDSKAAYLSFEAALFNSARIYAPPFMAMDNHHGAQE